jgi:fructose-specific phosphotransferase system IIC component
METEEEIEQEAQEVELQEATSEEEIQQEQEEYQATEETPTLKEEVKQKNLKLDNQVEDRSGFIHGLSVGLGIGCIATFVIVWISIFFAPQLPSVTYENLLAIFIYPLIYLLTVGLIALTAGIVREYYSKGKF